MKNDVFVKVVKQVIRLLGICCAVVLLVWISGFFVTLHPDAYQDAITSVVFIYGLFIVMSWGYSFLKSKRISKGQPIWLKKVGKWLKDESIIEAACGAFTLITLVNSLMMLTGYDTPKTGSFAYFHIIVRFLIISIVVAFSMWNDTVKLGKKCMSFLKSDFGSKKEFLLTNLHNFYSNVHKQLLPSISKLFTLTTIVFCVVVILLSSVINPEGGSFFYQLMLAILALITLLMIVVRYYRMHSVVKA